MAPERDLYFETWVRIFRVVIRLRRRLMPAAARSARHR